MPKLKDIPGLMINKMFWVGKVTEKQRTTIEYRRAFNDAISHQGEKRITHNREKLAKLCYQIIKNQSGMKLTWDEQTKEMRDLYLHGADEIIKNQASLFEVE